MAAFDQIEYARISDVGVRRSLNEDNHAILFASDEEKWRLQGHVFLVADGMGGHAVGELASEMAAANIPHTYTKYAGLGPARALRRAFLEANASIYARGQQNPDFKEMGTTTTALLLRPEGAWIAHVGDSRVYRVRDGFIEQLTFDHSHVWDIAQRLQVNPADVTGISSHLLMRSLGPQPIIQVDVEGPHPLKANDIFLVCTDGLSGQLTDPELGAVVSILPPEEACHFLVDLSNLRGGPDNITAIVLRVGALAETPTNAQPSTPLRKPWHQRIPWPLLVLSSGILFALIAALLTYNRFPGRVPVFLLAAIVIAIGLAGLLLKYRQEKQLAAEDDDPVPTELHLYRRAPCTVEPAFVHRLARVAEALKQRAEEKHWEVDWSGFQHHYDSAEENRKKGDHSKALAEYCRALRPLNEALARYRQRDEVLEPVWENE